MCRSMKKGKKTRCSGAMMAAVTRLRKQLIDIPNFYFIFWSFFPTPEGNHYFQPSKYACD